MTVVLGSFRIKYICHKIVASIIIDSISIGYSFISTEMYYHNFGEKY